MDVVAYVAVCVCYLTVIAFRSLILTHRQQRTNTLIFNMIEDALK